jgi:hypothetical protein
MAGESSFALSSSDSFFCALWSFDSSSFTKSSREGGFEGSIGDFRGGGDVADAAVEGERDAGFIQGEVEGARR